MIYGYPHLWKPPNAKNIFHHSWANQIGETLITVSWRQDLMTQTRWDLKLLDPCGQKLLLCLDAPESHRLNDFAFGIASDEKWLYWWLFLISGYSWYPVIVLSGIYFRFDSMIFQTNGGYPYKYPSIFLRACKQKKHATPYHCFRRMTWSVRPLGVRSAPHAPWIGVPSEDSAEVWGPVTGGSNVHFVWITHVHVHVYTCICICICICIHIRIRIQRPM